MVTLPIWRSVEIHTKFPKPQGYPHEVHKFGDAIKQKQMNLKLSKVQLAEILKVNVMSIWKWEEKDKKPVPKMLQCIIFLA